MSLSLRQYHATLAEWRHKYGVPPPPRVFGLTVKSIACAKKGCGTTKRTQRHHTGNDFWFALLLPDHFAARYLQFHSDDVAYLCDHHHKAAHKIYKRLMKEVWADLKEGGQRRITVQWAQEWMSEFRKAFGKWSRYPARKKRRAHKTRLAPKPR